MPSKTNILVITYYWPPGSGPGVQRWLKFSKFLLDHHIRAHILTVSNGSFPSRDESLLAEVAKGLPVYRTRSIEPFRLYNLLRGQQGKQHAVGMAEMKEPKSLLGKAANYIRANLFIPDARAGWRITALPKARKIIKAHNIELLVTTGPPHSTHCIGLGIKRTMDIPWLADFRDPWTTIYYNAYLNRTEASWETDRRLENEVLSRADAVVAVSPDMKREFEDRADRVEVIYNGYDENDVPPKELVRTETFTLAYVGNLKANQHLGALFTAIEELKSSFDGFGDHFRIEVTGNVADECLMAVKQANVEALWHQRSFVPHHEATRIMSSANLLLLPIPRAKNSKGILTGKLFEYLASRTPILALGPTDGDAADLLRSIEREPMIADDDTAAIREFIGRHYREWRESGGMASAVSGDAHKQFKREHQTSYLADLLKELMAHD